MYQAGLGGATTKAVEESFKVQVLYLSDELRIVEVSEDDDDEVRGAGGWLSVGGVKGCGRVLQGVSAVPER